MNILEELWHGNIQPMEWDEHRIEEQRDLVRLFERVESRLIVTLNDGQKEELQKLKDLGNEMQMITECGAFIMGFRLVVQLMAASMVKPAQGKNDARSERNGQIFRSYKQRKMKMSNTGQTFWRVWPVVLTKGILQVFRSCGILQLSLTSIRGVQNANCT